MMIFTFLIYLFSPGKPYFRKEGCKGLHLFLLFLEFLFPDIKGSRILKISSLAFNATASHSLRLGN